MDIMNRTTYLNQYDTYEDITLRLREGVDTVYYDFIFGEGKVNKDKQNNSYSFTTANPHSQIDLYSIASELTNKSPIAYVEAGEGGEFFGHFLVHRSLASKDLEVFSSTYNKGVYLYDGTLAIWVTAKHSLKQYKSHFKKVERASWPKYCRKPTTVKVSFPKL